MTVPPSDAIGDVAGSTTFLDAEEAAQRLAESLAALELEVTGYRTASQEISGVTEATARLAESIQSVGARSAEALDVLIAMGGPHIMKKLEALGERMAALESREKESVEVGTTNKMMLETQASEISTLKDKLSAARSLQVATVGVAALAAVAAIATLMTALIPT